MTGAFVRIQRNGGWSSFEIDQLTDDELEELEKSQPEKGWVWAKFLAIWIRDHSQISAN